MYVEVFECKVQLLVVFILYMQGTFFLAISFIAKNFFAFIMRSLLQNYLAGFQYSQRQTSYVRHH